MKKLLSLLCFLIFLSINTYGQVVGGLVRIATGAAVSRGLNKNDYDLRKRITTEIVINGETVKCMRTPQTELEKMKNAEKSAVIAATEMEVVERELEKCKVVLESKQILTQVPDLGSNFLSLKKDAPGVNTKLYKKELEFYTKMIGKPVL